LTSAAARFAAAAALWVAVAAVAAAQDGTVIASDATLRDFLVQNVCLDAGGAVLAGVAPIDGDRRCATARDLRPGERLPYHKHDHPSPGERAANPSGYQRHDSFPVETAGLGTVVEHSFDTGTGDGRRFGVFDTGSDGGDIVVVSPGIVSIGATEAGGGGFGLWVGECRGPLTAPALARSWILAEFDPVRPTPLEGETIARLSGVAAGAPLTCPSRFNPAYTSWRVVPFRYRAAPGQGTPVTLATLVSNHYGGKSRATADHVERFYFTRELGGTRWERWEIASGNPRFSTAKVAEMAAGFAATGRCSAPQTPTGPPGGGAPLVLVDCREWTRIEPPADPSGDRPGFFIDVIRARPDAPAFFAAPAGPR
jgi:hypothetical protein